MRSYELVIVYRASLTVEEKKELTDTIVGFVGVDNILATDDVGVIDTAYPLGGKKVNTHMGLVTYHIQIEPSQVSVISQKMRFLKGILRFFFYVMAKNDVFTTFAEIQKKVDQLLTSLPASVQDKHVSPSRK